MITARKIKLIGLDVIGISLGKLAPFFAAKLEGQRVRHPLRDRILDSENVRKFFVKRARPKGRTVCDLDQTRRHPDSIPRSLDSTVKDRIDL